MSDAVLKPLVLPRCQLAFTSRRIEDRELNDVIPATGVPTKNTGISYTVNLVETNRHPSSFVPSQTAEAAWCDALSSADRDTTEVRFTTIYASVPREVETKPRE